MATPVEYVTYTALRDSYFKSCNDMKKAGFSEVVLIDCKKLQALCGKKKKTKKKQAVVNTTTISGKVTKDPAKKKKAKFVGDTVHVSH